MDSFSPSLPLSLSLPPSLSPSPFYATGTRAAFCNTTITALETAVNVTVVGALIKCEASGNNSNRATYNIAPLANPKPTGNHGIAAETNKKTGMATKGWGKLEKILQPAVEIKDTPLGIKTTATAKPSGTL